MENSVELLGVFGDDLMVANVARVSYGKESKELTDRDIRLINFLWNHKPRHVSPFKHPQIQIRVKCPIFVERQLFKHQIGFAANSISGRYVDFSAKFWEASDLRKQSEDSKQGSSSELIDRPDLITKMKNHNLDSKNLYNELCEAGVAKEIARTVLPLNLQTEFIWTGSLLAYAHLFELRLEKSSQVETTEVVQQILEKIIDTGKFSYTLKAMGL